MQDPFFAVKEEVDHAVAVVVDLHKKWRELPGSSQKADEYEWTSSELLSGLRSIEWDLQDLEDTVSIVEGNRQKFQLDEADVQARKDFIETTRQQIVSMREEVQGSASSEIGTSGFSTNQGGTTLPKMGAKSKGYGKVGLQEELPMADDVESASKTSQHMTPSVTDEILGVETGFVAPAKGRHTKKKICLACSVLLLAAGAAAFVMMKGPAPKSLPATEVLESPSDASDRQLTQVRVEPRYDLFSSL